MAHFMCLPQCANGVRLVRPPPNGIRQEHRWATHASPVVRVIYLSTGREVSTFGLDSAKGRAWLRIFVPRQRKTSDPFLTWPIAAVADDRCPSVVYSVATRRAE